MADIITLKTLCEELKIDPREARERLRAAASDAKASPELAKQAVGHSVHEYARDWEKPSDHVPVVIDLDMDLAQAA